MANPQQFLSFFIHNPMGEEILEGTAGGLLAGAGTAAGGDIEFGDALIRTGSAIAGGIGLGMAGRRLGARIGKKIQPKALKDQDSFVATTARMLGSETTVEGLKSQGNMLKNTVQQGLVNESVTNLVEQARKDPSMFQKTYNIDPQSFLKNANNVKYGNAGVAFLNTVKDISPEKRKILTDKIMNEMGLEEFSKSEKLVRERASANIDNLVNAAMKGELDSSATAELLKNTGSKSGSIADIVTDMMSPKKPVTGEEVGRAIGRAAGDEIGVLGGLGVGSLISSGLGIDSPKDKQIKELEKKLLNR
jgi:hypothetical protein